MLSGDHKCVMCYKETITWLLVAKNSPHTLILCKNVRKLIGEQIPSQSDSDSDYLDEKILTACNDCIPNMWHYATYGVLDNDCQKCGCSCAMLWRYEVCNYHYSLNTGNIK